eukprot:gene40283-49814_t
MTAPRRTAPAIRRRPRHAPDRVQIAAPSSTGVPNRATLGGHTPEYPMFSPSLVIRNGTIVDGSGGDPYEADLSIVEGRIAAIAKNLPKGQEEIDARGRLVTPGFVDVHTHYDAQVTWSERLSPSSWNGATTVVMGNCGVGFAPVKPDRREWLISVMEGVEDIPGTVLSEGIQWEWETFPQYLDALAAKPRALDVGAQVPHSAVRTYVMGERGVTHDEATADDIRAIGTNTLDIYPGRDFGDDKAQSIRTLVPADLQAIAAQPFVHSVTPATMRSLRLRYRSIDINGNVNGVSDNYFAVRDVQMASGIAFNANDVRHQSQVV